MVTRTPVSSLTRNALLLGCLTLAQAAVVSAQDGKVKPPEWKHGMDLKARKADEKEFTKDTKKYGVEAFADPNTGKLTYISEPGSFAALTGTAMGGDKSKEPEFHHGLTLRVRKAGEADFTDKTKRYGVECFRDLNANTFIYVSETGSISVVPSTGGSAPKEVKKPEWRHGLTLPARKAGEAEFTPSTKRYGVEVFVDPNNGNLIYITEEGTIAVTAGEGLPAAGKVKNPEWKHGMELKVRNAGDADFNDKTPKVGVEVWLDPNANRTVFITEKGHISLVNSTKFVDTKNRNPDWKHGLEMAVRKPGVSEWEKASKYGMEVYADELTNTIIYIVQTGALAALPAK